MKVRSHGKKVELGGKMLCSKCFPFVNDVSNSPYFIIKLNLNILLFMIVI
jgi:hypothetical protein